MLKRFDRLRSRVAAAFVVMLIAPFAAGPGRAAALSTELSVTGAVTTPRTYDLAGLSALPPITQTVTYLSGSTPQTRTYTGASLWGVLGSSGIVVDPAVKNDILNKVVVATGTDGYRVVFAAGELSPDFGNRPDLVAYADAAYGDSLGPDGFARITSPGDVKGGRYVSNLVNLDVRASGSTQTGSGGGVSTQFTVSGAVTQAKRFDLSALQALPTLTSSVGGISYTGVSFWSLLTATVGIPLDPTVKNDLLGKYVVATGSDGYQAVFSLGELSPDFGNQPDLIAYAADGAGLGSNGFARIIVPNDVKKGRWVSNLVSLEVFSTSPVPEPPTAAAMLLGLAVTAAWRGRRLVQRQTAGPMPALPTR